MKKKSLVLLLALSVASVAVITAALDQRKQAPVVEVRGVVGQPPVEEADTHRAQQARRAAPPSFT